MRKIIKKKYFSIIALIAVFTLSSCSKNDDDSTDKTPVQTIDLSQLAGEWKLVGWTSEKAYDINSDGESTADLFSQLDACHQQSGYRFLSLTPESKDNYSISVFNTTDIKGCEEIVRTFPYIGLNYDEKQFEITQKYGYPIVYKIQELTAEVLKLEARPFGFSGFYDPMMKSVSVYKRIK